MIERTLILGLIAVFQLSACAAEIGDEVSEQSETEVVGQASSELSLLSPGSSIRNGVGPNILLKSHLYTLSLPQQGGAGVINDTRWTWSLSYRPVGLGVTLCRLNTSSCIDITNQQTGVTTAWAGLTSNVPFLFTFFVNGSGTVSPQAFGKSDQVIINYH